MRVIHNPLIPQKERKHGERGNRWDLAHYDCARFDLLELRSWIDNAVEEDCLTVWVRDEFARLNHTAQSGRIEIEDVAKFMADLEDALKAIYERLGSINTKFEEATKPPTA